MSATSVLASTFVNPSEWDAPESEVEDKFSLFRSPRIHRVPTRARRNTRLCLEVVDLCGEAGLVLDHWQEYVLQSMLALNDEGKWAALRFGLVLGRQNGKGGCIEARELAALFLDPDEWPEVAVPQIIYTAHEASTAGQEFNKLWSYIEDSPRLRRKVKGDPNRAEGKQRITLLDGRHILFRTRTKKAGRGMSPGLLFFDEAMSLSDIVHESLYYAASAQPNPQVIYAGSAGDQQKWDPALGLVLARLRMDAIRGDDPDLGYVEYSLDYERPEDVPDLVADDPEMWERCNPAMGIRLTRRFMATERRGSKRGFVRERLSVGDWPAVDGADAVIPLKAWAACGDPHAEPRRDKPVFAFDVSPLRSQSSVAVAGRREDGRIVVGLLKCHPGTDWLLGFLAELHRKYGRQATFLYETSSPAASFGPKLDDARLNVRPVNGPEFARACGNIYDAAVHPNVSDRLVHRDEDALNDAVKGAKKRDSGERFIWTRKKSESDITPLVACTLAFDHVFSMGTRRSSVINLNDVPEPEEDEDFDLDSLPDWI